MSLIEASRLIAIVALCSSIGVVPGCKDDPTPVVETECRPNQFRRCDAECGRGVEQCVEPGVWNGCACTVLDAAIPDARRDRDASDGGATDAPLDTGAGEAGDGADGTGDAEAGDADAGDADAGDSGEVDSDRPDGESG
jgi:hypothetical protein